MSKRLQETRHPDDKTELNKVIKEPKTLLIEHRTASIREQKLRELSDATNANVQKNPTRQILPLRKVDGARARNPREKAKAFANHPSRVFQPHRTGNTTSSLSGSDTTYKSKASKTSDRFRASENIRSQRNYRVAENKEASGWDLIDGKNRKRKTHEIARYSFNRIIDLHYLLPPRWEI